MFITVEGGEASGKTTLIRNLAEHLESNGKTVLMTREPGGTPFGEAVRQMLLDPKLDFSFGSRAEMLLFLSARVQHIEEVIQPALSKGVTVLCDRFNDSTIAYQGGARGLGVDQVEQLCLEACQGFHPDLTFFLDINPEKAFERMKGEKDRLEEETYNFHHKVRSAFHTLKAKHSERIHMINADQPPETVFREALKIIP